jgi:KRAB domain-containing zinc finger protein
VCETCGQKFRFNCEKNRHMKFHKNPEEFKCKICGHQSTQKSNLQSHLKTHETKNLIKPKVALKFNPQ